MGGPEGEIGLPKDPFHAFDGPGTDWPPETQAFPPEKPSESNSTASIDLDAEATRPACSPLHHTSTTQKPTLSYSSCVPPSAVLPAPQTQELEGHIAATMYQTTGKRHSKRLASLPASSAKPAERARETKLKKLGIKEEGKNKKY
jgi:hypothetical protein